MKAIETKYKGYRFRSRLEARWAVFFDTLGVKWEYEPEGFEFPDGMRYLPDFLLRQNGEDFYAEVKAGDYSDAAFVKARRLCQGAGVSVICLAGPPDIKAYRAYEPYLEGGELCGYTDTHMCFHRMPKRAGRVIRYADSGDGYDPDSVASLLGGTPVRRAVAAARSARFEFGECGAIA